MKSKKEIQSALYNLENSDFNDDYFKGKIQVLKWVLNID